MNHEQERSVATVHVTPDMDECIRHCTECHQVCLETLNYSLKMGSRFVESVHLRLLIDCAEMCQTSANFMVRASDLHTYTCGVCARVCRDCATDCERYAVPGEGSGAPMSKQSGKAESSAKNVDEQMKKCAEVCRRCADSCQRMSDMKMNG